MATKKPKKHPAIRALDCHMADSGLSQNKTASLLGINQGALSRLRNGRYSPKIETIQGISKLTGMPVALLLP